MNVETNKIYLICHQLLEHCGQKPNDLMTLLFSPTRNDEPKTNKWCALGSFALSTHTIYTLLHGVECNFHWICFLAIVISHFVIIYCFLVLRLVVLSAPQTGKVYSLFHICFTFFFFRSLLLTDAHAHTHNLRVSSMRRRTNFHFVNGNNHCMLPMPFVSPSWWNTTFGRSNNEYIMINRTAVYRHIEKCNFSLCFFPRRVLRHWHTRITRTHKLHTHGHTPYSANEFIENEF